MGCEGLLPLEEALGGEWGWGLASGPEHFHDKTGEASLESHLQARKARQVSDFIPPQKRRGLIKRGSP